MACNSGDDRSLSYYSDLLFRSTEYDVLDFVIHDNPSGHIMVFLAFSRGFRYAGMV